MQDEYVKRKEESYSAWLNDKNQWFRDKLWQVVVELKAEQDITGKTTTEIPLERFRNKNINLEDARKLLIQLDNKEIIHVGKTVGSNADKTGFLVQPLEDEKSLFNDPDTRINFTHEFKYLYSVLNKLQHPEKKKALGSLDKKADKIIEQFSLQNLPFVIIILQRIKDAIEFASDAEAQYKLVSSPETNQIVQERQLLRKLESYSLFRHSGEDGIFGIATLMNLNHALIKKSIERGRRRLAIEELRKRNIRLKTQKLMVESRQFEKPSDVRENLEIFNWPKNATISKGKFMFDDKNWIEFKTTTSGRFKIFKTLFEAGGKWVPRSELEKLRVGDTKRTIAHIEDAIKKQNTHTSSISIKRSLEEGQLQLRIAYSP